GRIIVITNLAAPTRSVFLDITNRVNAAADTSTADERGLLSMAFHPGYATNGLFYVWYTGNDTTSLGSGMHDVLARYQVSATNANVASTNEQRLISQFDRYQNHNGGDLHFGPTDGCLYLSIGDEGAQQGTNGNPQRINLNFFSGIFRLDVDKRPGNLPPNPHPAVVTNAGGQAFYLVPVDNPFVHTSLGGDWGGFFNSTNYTGALASIRTEYWAVGLRNPFRFTFSPLDNTLFLGDVGEQDEEEINIIERGRNYGWNWYDGTNSRPGYTPTNGIPLGFTNTPPLTYYTQVFTADKYSVICGPVSTGARLSQLYGALLFADYGKGNVWAMRSSGTNVQSIQELFIDDFEAGLGNVSTFGVDPSNQDVLYADLRFGTNGVLKRIIYATNAVVGAPLPPTLADAGVFTNLSTLAPAPGIVPYTINVPFWSDGAVKSRWFSLPDTNLTFGFNADGNWSFPTGAVWIKHFELELTNGVAASRRRLETRLLVRNTAGVYGVTYRWGDSLTNAFLVPEAGTNESFVIDDGGGILRTQAWHYPGRAECLQCHTAQGGFALGFNTAQLNCDFNYPASTTNQLQALSDAGYLTAAISNRMALRALAPATNTAVSLEYRVRSYLDSNCRQCHQGSGIAFWDARISTPLAQAGIVNGPVANSFGNAANRVVAPGSLVNSVLHSRIANLNSDHMPPLGTSEPDTQSIALVAAWITNALPAYQSFADWQLAKFGSTNAPMADAQADADGDGAVNYLEYLTGTEPLVPGDAWRITATRTNGAVVVQFLQTANRGYEVQFADTSVSPMLWQTLTVPGNMPFFSAVSFTNAIPDPVVTNAARFYRVRVFEP
ncbi:MAG: hypothetical protein RLY20_556, partial [Verrucomicrobiota bacterium]